MFAHKFRWWRVWIVVAAWWGLHPGVASADEVPGVTGHAISPAEARIHAALGEPTEMEFIETPLLDVTDYLSDLHDIRVHVDAQALDEMGIGSDTPITANLRNISLKSALRLILKPLDLDYVVHSEVLQITSKQALEQMTDTRVYPVGDLIDDAHYAEHLAEIVRATVIQPTTARAVPNNAVDAAKQRAASRALVTYRDLLIVRDTPRVHEEVVELLTQMRRVSKTAVPEPLPGE